MRTKLIPLSDIPYAARNAEAAERARWPTRAMALDAATYEIIAAEGCYSGAFAPTRGWVLTERAAEAVAGMVVNMPGGSCHRDQDYQENTYETSDALGEYIEAVARGVPQAEAVAAYQAARKVEAR